MFSVVRSRALVSLLVVGLLAAWCSPLAEAEVVSAASKPDANVIVFVGAGQTKIGFIDADGSHLRFVTPMPRGVVYEPVLSPDGTKVAFVSSLQLGLCSNEIYIMNVDGSDVAALPGVEGCALDPVWSPDGTRIAYDSSLSGNGSPDVWVIDAGGGTPSELAAGSQPTWSPDGTQVAYTDTSQVLVASAAGGPATQVTHLSSGYVSQPIWSPDGRYIAFQDTAPNVTSSTEMIVTPQGAGLQALFSSDNPGGVSWAPDSHRFVISNNEVAKGLAIVGLGGQVDSTLPTGEAQDASWIDTSPTNAPGGYWLAAADGGIFTFGNAKYYGSEGGTHLNAPIVGIATTPNGGGYWLVAADGGIFTFGNAKYYGSGAEPLTPKFVAIQPSTTGAGYRLAGTDGSIYSLGDATYNGALNNTPINQPIVAIGN